MRIRHAVVLHIAQATAFAGNQCCTPSMTTTDCTFTFTNCVPRPSRSRLHRLLLHGVPTRARRGPARPRASRSLIGASQFPHTGRRCSRHEHEQSPSPGPGRPRVAAPVDGPAARPRRDDSRRRRRDRSGPRPERARRRRRSSIAPPPDYDSGADGRRDRAAHHLVARADAAEPATDRGAPRVVLARPLRDRASRRCASRT